MSTDSTQDMMIVVALMIKNESASIVSTLQNLVDNGMRSFLVLDTGSTDGTVEIVRSFFTQSNLNGVIHEEPFIDFATSRNRTLSLTKHYFSQVPFILMPDAEWYLQGGQELIEFCHQEVPKSTPLYLIETSMNGVQFTVARLFRTNSDIQFKGVVHEVPDYVATMRVPNQVRFQVVASDPGIEKTRRRWKRDLTLLLAEHQKHPTDPRTAFYLAQTYDCLGETEAAYRAYQVRSRLCGWDEENYIAALRLGKVAEQLSLRTHSTITWSTAMEHYLHAFSLRPSRIEPLVRIADHYWPDNIPSCFLFIRHAYDLPYPEQDILFIQHDDYIYHRYEIMSRCAWHMQEYKLGADATKLALAARPDTPHLLQNLKIYDEAQPTTY